MIRLSERLSEFSYGYGVTEETRWHLAQLGQHTVPFLPNLVHENSLGFDVAFSKPGAVLLLQFKLGDQLKRFHRTHPTQAIPTLSRPFWRFGVDLDGAQFQRLEDFEGRGAEVYYVAPRFATWQAYQAAFLGRTVLQSSLLITPAAIRQAAGAASGAHRVVYDLDRSHVCSEPVEAPQTPLGTLLHRQRLGRGSCSDDDACSPGRALHRDRAAEGAQGPAAPNAEPDRGASWKPLSPLPAPRRAAAQPERRAALL